MSCVIPCSHDLLNWDGSQNCFKKGLAMPPFSTPTRPTCILPRRLCVPLGSKPNRRFASHHRQNKRETHAKLSSEHERGHIDTQFLGSSGNGICQRYMGCQEYPRTSLCTAYE